MSFSPKWLLEETNGSFDPSPVVPVSAGLRTYADSVTAENVHLIFDLIFDLIFTLLFDLIFNQPVSRMQRLARATPRCDRYVMRRNYCSDKVS